MRSTQQSPALPSQGTSSPYNSRLEWEELGAHPVLFPKEDAEKWNRTGETGQQLVPTRAGFRGSSAFVALTLNHPHT